MPRMSKAEECVQMVKVVEGQFIIQNVHNRLIDAYSDDAMKLDGKLQEQSSRDRMEHAGAMVAGIR